MKATFTAGPRASRVRHEFELSNLCTSHFQLIIYFWIASISAFAQAELKKIVPPSPTAAGLAKYGDIPVGYYTGSASISIPLYTVNTGDFSLPISLSYHSSGVKVEEMASWVGLNWSRL
jgi:hypothetical protein